VLDVGCSDGLIGFDALEKIASGMVILSDISQDLLEYVQSLARDMGLLDRCQFVRAPAEDLSPLDNASVDVVALRSVLIYVSAKQQSFREFYRVLKPSGRLSILEPINRFGTDLFDQPQRFAGYDVTPVIDIAQKIKAVYRQLQPVDSDPMLNFDERNLITYVEQAGFGEIHLELQVDIVPTEDNDWHAFIGTAGNPNIPTIEEAMQWVLRLDEMERFIACLRPLVGSRQGIHRRAVAYLWAVK
jgi:ubiquinone/menaquinone biosynthesis C-methylase UbiE